MAISFFGRLLFLDHTRLSKFVDYVDYIYIFIYFSVAFHRLKKCICGYRRREGGRTRCTSSVKAVCTHDSGIMLARPAHDKSRGYCVSRDRRTFVARGGLFLRTLDATKSPTAPKLRGAIRTARLYSLFSWQLQQKGSAFPRACLSDVWSWQGCRATTVSA